MANRLCEVLQRARLAYAEQTEPDTDYFLDAAIEETQVILKMLLAIHEARHKAWSNQTTFVGTLDRGEP